MEVLVNKVFENAIAYHDRLAVAYKNELLSYRTLANATINFSYELKELGATENNHIFISAVSKQETVVAYLAITLIGAVAVFLDKNATAELVEKLYAKIDGNLLLTDKKYSLSEKVKTASLHEMYEKAVNGKVHISYPHVDRDSERISEILFTSGTTGVPKGVMLSFRTISAVIMGDNNFNHHKKDDVLLIPTPLHHTLALRKLRTGLYNGCTCVLQNGFTFAKDLENNIIKYNCSAMECVPASFPIVEAQMKNRFSEIVGRLKLIEVGAGSLSENQKKKYVELLPKTKIICNYGASEVGGTVIFCNASNLIDNGLENALGKSDKQMASLKIVDCDYNEFSSTHDNPGRLMIEGDMVFSGYYKDEENTKKSLVNGGYLSNDLAYIKDGYICMLGRSDDLINVGGEKVYPVEIENAASQYHGIVECACVGIPDPEEITGQVPAIFVVKNDTYNEVEFMGFLKKQVTKYQLPKVIKYIEALPRNAMQKIDRKVLRTML